ncbi:hypothetical protein [Actinomadura sp. 9N407]|uniref:hypothetical protein n=1 Tax=Actinomadura sp. 9N407 TaxID=3375154 RepID=UPI00378AC636
MATFCETMRALLSERDISLRALAGIVHHTDGYLSRLSRDLRVPSAEVAASVDDALGADGELIALAQAAASSGGRAANVDSEAHPIPEDDDEMQRRRLLQALATLGATSSPAVEALQCIRSGVDRALARDEDSHLDEWEEAVAEYGYSYLLLPPHRLLPDLAADLVAVQQIAARHARGRLHADWCRVAGGLALLMAKTLCNAGQPRLARDWWITAQHAADSSGDIDLGLWIAGERLTHGLYEHRPVAVLLRKAGDLIERSPRAPCRGLAIVGTVRAQLLALEGRAREAAAELRTCEEIFQALPVSATDVRSVRGWAEDRVRHSEAWVYAHVGDRVRLEESVARTKALVPSTDARVHTQLGLLRASGHVREGDVSEGVRLAHSVYEAHPAEHRTAMVSSLARQVAEAVPQRSRTEPVVVGYRELLAASRGKSIT